MIKVEKIIEALTRDGSLIFANNLSYAVNLEKMIPNLKIEEKMVVNFGTKMSRLQS